MSLTIQDRAIRSLRELVAQVTEGEHGITKMHLLEALTVLEEADETKYPATRKKILEGRDK